MHAGQSATRLRLWRRRSALAVNRNVYRMVSDGDKVLLMQKLTIWEQKCAQDGQRE